MKAHIAKNQHAGTPAMLVWNLSAGDRGKLDGMAAAFGMRILPVAPADAGRTVAQLLGEAEGGAPAPAQTPADTPAALLANFREQDLDTLLDLLRQAQVYLPLKAVATDTNRSWRFADLLAHLAEERAAYAAAAAQQAAAQP